MKYFNQTKPFCFKVLAMNFGKYLTHLREAARLSKVDLSKIVDVTDTYIRNMEHGRNPPPDFALCDKILKAVKADASQRKKFLELAFEERLKEDVAFLHEIRAPHFKQSDNETEPISKEVLQAIEDPVALKALLITHKGSEDIKKAIKQLLETFPTMAPEKRKAILALCN
jgi:transcriptional regulator with XRE-family HTH domain